MPTDSQNAARLAAEAAAKAKAATPEAIAAKTAEQVAAGVKSTDPNARIGDETATQANARITQGYKDQPQPELTKEGAAAGATIEFVRTGAGGVGVYKEVFPIGTAIPETRTTTSGNVYDAKGTLVSGTGLKSGTGTAVTSTATTSTVTTNPTTSTVNVQPQRPVGTPDAFIYDPATKTYKMPPVPTGPGKWVFDPNSGWVDSNLNPGSTGLATGSEKTLALDTFKNTLGLYFGAKEMSQSWVNSLFKVVSGFYKSGSDVAESLNLAVAEARFNPEMAPFTKRFAGVYSLQDALARGEAVSVPTIAEFFESEVALGDIFRQSGLGELATQDFLGDILGRNKSVAEVTNLINDTFKSIDNAPDALKKDLQAIAPGIDRTSIAKALLMGKAGAEELNKKIAATSVFSAAKSQGIGIDMATAGDYAARGFDYNESLTNFGKVALGAAPLQKLSEISMGQAAKMGESQKTLQESLFQNDVKAQEKIRLEAEKEMARFNSSSGTGGSRSLASSNRANRAI